jgi:AcrR family transcriptional regulator
MPGQPSTPTTPRGQAKADRRAAMLAAAAELFAQRGYNGVSIEDLGTAVGVSGPAVYRHFSGKQAVLAALLIDVSEGLVAGGEAVVAEGMDDAATLRALVAFHVDFALGNPDVIVVQDRDLASLGAEDQHRVRALQRNYVELWVAVLERLHPGTEAAALRVRAHATFGLMNSTPHSGRARGIRELLARLALAALTA